MSLFQGTFPELREFQVSAHEEIRQAVRDGHRMILLMAPTGSGKTILGFNVVRETNGKGNRAGFVCDRRVLISQTSNAARDVGLGNHGIIQANNPLLDLSRPFQIMSCQTLRRRGWPTDLDVVIVDEAHTLYATWVDELSVPPKACPRCGRSVVTDPGRPNFPRCEDRTGCRWKMPIVIGLSATPFTKGLGTVFTKLINAATMDHLVQKGILVPLRIFSCRRPNMEGAEVGSDGEWTERAQEKAEMVLVGDVITEWARLAQGKKTIAFGPTILYCEELAKKFNEAGIPAGVVCADTPDDLRQKRFDDFHWGRLTVLISVDALAKGFDQRDVEVVCDCRPLRKSLSTAIQMWGRGLRASIETGKTECRLLDFSGNIIRFADDFSRIYYEGLDKLDDGERLDREVREDKGKEPATCPKCGYTPMGGKKCVGCGYEIPKPVLHEHLPGEMKEIRLQGKNGAVLAPDEAHMWAQLCTYAKSHGKDNKWAFGHFIGIVGHKPPLNFRFETAPLIQPTPTTMSKLHSMRIAYAKAKAKGEKLQAAS
ncbi:DEAD/DEAH box helicase [Mesoterricola sediminis]|uniref:Helicase n=1 Tax=Mesoterricola sediminis TaxID=2927980 RepID=A0AA48GV95_9BACT|nr:DEAD/DEAH box helicase family protein [Mesoterricola sediminis]BDU76270.1 hypothetical protein METESE_12280 [Mesoterricola sediminis]